MVTSVLFLNLGIVLAFLLQWLVSEIHSLSPCNCRYISFSQRLGPAA